MSRAAIDKSGARKDLDPRREPYWGAPLSRGLYLGFRRTEQGGTWIARWRDDDGKQRYNSLGQVGPTCDFEDARRMALAWHRKLLAGVVADGQPTVSDACRQYVAHLRDAGRESTAHDADLRFKRTVFDQPLDKIKLERITTAALVKWRNEQVRSGLSKASVNRNLVSLKAALNLAVSSRKVASERAIEWREAKPYGAKEVANRRDLFLDRDQRRALLAATEGGLRDLVEAAMHTGARPGELVSALRSQYDGRTGMLTLSGKTGTRTIPLSPSARDLFSRLARGKLPTARLLVRDDGKPWAPSDWDELVRDAAKAAKLPPGVCLYTLRHSWITAALTDPENHLSTLEVARLVGTSLPMIDRNYGHLATKAAQARLAKLVIA